MGNIFLILLGKAEILNWQETKLLCKQQGCRWSSSATKLVTSKYCSSLSKSARDTHPSTSSRLVCQQAFFFFSSLFSFLRFQIRGLKLDTGMQLIGRSSTFPNNSDLLFLYLIGQRHCDKLLAGGSQTPLLFDPIAVGQTLRPRNLTIEFVWSICLVYLTLSSSC